jgi:hypothetical protein
MKKLIFIITLLGAHMMQGSDLPTFFSEADSFFKKNVANGKVHYKSVKGNFSEISGLYQDIGEMDLSNATDESRKAFYINAYNLIVIYQVSKYYPLKSPLDKSGFFDKVRHKVAGESLTLNALELKKLVFATKDARIHFVLACAANSCPPLASFSFVPGKLEQQLEDRTKLSINNTNWLKTDDKSKQVYLSKIFDWYEKDFTMNGEKSVVDFINQYKSTPIPADFKVRHYEYDWGLNEG